MDIDGALITLAERQHGMVGLDQVRALGMTYSAVAHRRRRGDWELTASRVLHRRGAPLDDGARAMAAVLDVGGDPLLSHTSAAAWWSIPGFHLDPLHVTRTRGGTRRPSSLARVHEPCALPHHQRGLLDGVPVVRPAMAIFQLAATVHPGRVERACDNAWSMRLVSGPQLHDLLEELAARGRDGTIVMREILASRPRSYVPPASNLERRFAAILAERGLEPMDRQVELGGERWLGRVDFKDRRLPLVVEVQSERYHTALLDQQADEDRLAALRAAGFVVVPVQDTDVWSRPAEVARRVGRARHQLLGYRPRAA